MIALEHTAASRRTTVLLGDPEGRYGAEPAQLTGEGPAGRYWTDPGTAHVYPLSYRGYRRAREAEEKTPPRHRTLGADIDHYVWRRGPRADAPDLEVRLTVKPDAPLRIQRIVAEVLRAIRRGEPAGDAIRHVARRFGLRNMRARAFITDSIGFEVLPRDETIDASAAAPWVAAAPVM